MGFLYGTVFAVFYAVFGIPLARFADVYVRKNLISVGLMFWSAMTALSGFAKSFPQLALFRIGVGVVRRAHLPQRFPCYRTITHRKSVQQCWPSTHRASTSAAG